MASGVTDDFDSINRAMIRRMSEDPELRRLSRLWFQAASRYQYSYHFTWLGRPIIQFPQDVMALQELVWKTQPDLILETGVARGGSLIFYASLLELLGGDREVVGIDVDVRPHNRAAIVAHPLSRRIRIVDGSSTDPEIVRRVRDLAAGRRSVFVVLDSLHTRDHVLAELEAYSPLVKPPSYVIVLDTIIDEMPADFSRDRPWRPGDSPMSAVREFLGRTDRFAVDEETEAKLLLSVAPKGYLRCVKD